MIKGIPIVKCVKCGKTTIEDEFQINGCVCGSHESVTNDSFKRREYLKKFLDKGWVNCTGRFIKKGCVHYRNNSKYALVGDLMIDGEYVTNHTYIQNVNQLSYLMLNDIKPGDKISFNAKVCSYHHDTKFGMSEMIRLTI
jgi:hypothetical protein